MKAIIDEGMSYINSYFLNDDLKFLDNYFEFAFEKNEIDLERFFKKISSKKNIIKNPEHPIYSQSIEEITKLKELLKNFKKLDSFREVISNYMELAKEQKTIDTKTEIKKLYDNYFERFKSKNKFAEYIIFYESPPDKINNYLLNDPSNSHYCGVLKKYFDFKNQDIADFLIDKSCLFVDILDIPIDLDKELFPGIRLFWSEINPPFTYLLFRNKVQGLIESELINDKTKVAIGMPPNSSVGIYNYIPLDKTFYDDNEITEFYNKLVKGNDELNRSSSKMILYKRTKFNSHKSNVFFSQNPNLEMLKYAWE
jgi:hypothetical protein